MSAPPPPEAARGARRPAETAPELSDAVAVEDAPGPAEQEVSRQARAALEVPVLPLAVALLGDRGDRRGRVRASCGTMRRPSSPPTSPPPAVPITVEPNTVVELDPSSGKVLASFDVGVDPERRRSRRRRRLGAERRCGHRLAGRPGARRCRDHRLGAQGSGAGGVGPGRRLGLGLCVARRQAARGRRVFGLPRGADADRDVAALGLGGGYLWVVKPPAEEGQPETVSLVDVATGNVAGSAPIGMDSQFVAFGHGVAWISSQRDDTVTTVSTSGEAETFKVPARAGSPSPRTRSGSPTSGTTSSGA